MSGEALEFDLLVRLREVLAGSATTEVELRRLSEQADAWARTLHAQVEASELRLGELTADSASSLAAIADELRRIEELRPQLSELRSQLEELNARARELRTAWLLEQAASETRAQP